MGHKMSLDILVYQKKISPGLFSKTIRLMLKELKNHMKELLVAKEIWALKIKIKMNEMDQNTLTAFLKDSINPQIVKKKVKSMEPLKTHL